MGGQRKVGDVETKAKKKSKEEAKTLFREQEEILTRQKNELPAFC